MKLNSSLFVISLFLTASTLPLAAADHPQEATWHAHSLGQAIMYMLIFSGIGIGVAVVGYKIFDKCTPGDLHKEIVQNKNVAAAVVAAAVILGMCIIVAAAMLG